VKTEDIAYLYSLTNEYRSIRYDLHNMRALIAALGDPQEAFESILIAGTNGKGSVARMLSAMMPDAGLYTSPHLERLNERIRIGDQEISDSDLQSVFEKVKAAAETAPGLLYPPTYFEIVTAMAFLYFQDRVKFAVLEVGLGGRLDATNAVRQKVSVITSIGLDHQQFLGASLEDIAAEKAGIIKGGEPVVVGVDVDYTAIRERADRYLFPTQRISREVRSLGSGYFEVDVRTPIRAYLGLRPSLAGRHQVDNAILAIRAAECLGLKADQIRSGIETAKWPGRLERFEGKPPIILDGAHNPHAAKALAAYLGEFFPGGVWMIFGAMADKKSDDMISLLSPHVSQWIFTKPQSERARDPQSLMELSGNAVVEDDVRSALAFARKNAPEGATVVVCGSLFLIGEARAVLN
jgi:dihydrofolate synthase/folylpolyglutamate synthase